MNAFLDELVRNLSSPLSSLILQILVILWLQDCAASSWVTWDSRK
jgi:hypothetical protein